MADAAFADEVLRFAADAPQVERLVLLGAPAPVESAEPAVPCPVLGLAPGGDAGGDVAAMMRFLSPDGLAATGG